MKKLLTILFCAASISSFAQPSQQWPAGNHSGPSNNTPRNVYNNNNNNNDDKRGFGERRYEESYSFALRERDNQLARINREFDSRIHDIKSKWFMRGGEKNRAIRDLEFQRSEQIRMVYARFDDKRNKYNDKYYDKNYNWRR